MDDLGERLIAHAALSGPFEPARFRYLDPSERRSRRKAGTDGSEAAITDEEWSRALAGLAPLCEEVAANGVQKWVMRTAERSRALAALADRPALVARLYRWRPPRRDDVFAMTLQRCLGSGDPPAAEDLAASDLREAISAAIFAGGMVPEARRAAIKAFEQALYRRAVAKAEAARTNAVLPHPLVGRVAERKAVLNLIRTGDVAAPLRRIGDASAGSLLLTGSPGIGKSAFLADVVQRLRHDADRTYVVTFDFDQFTLTRGSVVAWAEELTRQIGAQWDEAGAAAVARVRAEHSRRRLDRQRSDEPSASAEDAAALVGDAWSAMAGLPPGPLAIVADTIEEITARDSLEQFLRAPDNTLFRQLLGWVVALRRLSEQRAGPFSAVRLLASGRTGPPVAPAVLGDWFTAELDLPVLDEGAASALIADRDAGLDADTRARIVAVVGGHPLHLLMVQQHLSGLKDAAERASLLAELETEGLRGALPATATQTLYSRFIDRLRIRGLPPGLGDGDIRKLARSGLLLREVTERLLAEVVGPAAGVDLSGEGRAGAALAALREQVWLVVPGDGGGVRHRPDVRRVMLPMLLDRRNPANRALLDAAVAWFEDRAREPGVADEAGYLRALRGDPDDIAFLADPSRAAVVLSLAGGDLEAMTVASRAILKVAARPDEPLSAAELAALPPSFRTEALVRQESAALRTFGGTTKAGLSEFTQSTASFFDERGGESDYVRGGYPLSRPSPTDAYQVLNDRTLHAAVEVAFLESDFKRVAELGWTAIRRVSRWPDLTRPLNLDTPFDRSWLWRSLLAFAVSPPPWDEVREAPLVAALIADEKVLASGAVRPSPDAPFLSQGRFDLLPFLDMAAIPRELPRSRGAWRGSPARLNDFRELRLAAAIASLRRMLAGEPVVETAVLTSLPLLGAPLVDAGAREIAPGAGTKVPRIEELIVGVPSNPGLLDELYDRLDELSVGGDAGWSLTVHPGRPAGLRSLAAVLRGTTPELHATVVASLLRLPPPVVVDAVEEAARSAPFWPPSLSGRVAGSGELGGRSRSPVLHRLVRWLDLCGRLGAFLQNLHGRAPAPDLAAQLELIRALDRLWRPEPVPPGAAGV